MTYQYRQFSEIKNVSAIERSIRGVVGLALMEAVLLIATPYALSLPYR